MSNLTRSIGAAAVLETAADTPPIMKSIYKEKEKIGMSRNRNEFRSMKRRVEGVKHSKK
jgi:hypothetical protein